MLSEVHEIDFVFNKENNVEITLINVDISMNFKHVLNNSQSG